MATLNPYGRMSEADQERFIARRKARRRITIIVLSSLVLIGVVVAAVLGSISHSNDDEKKSRDDQMASISSSVKAVCNATLYPDSCYSSLAPLINSSGFSVDDIYKLSVQVAINELSRASQAFSQDGGFSKFNITNPYEVKALESCQELLSLALEHLNNSLSVPDKSFFQAFEDVRTWLSAAGTYQETCIDGFENNHSSMDTIFHSLKNSTEYTSNSLAIITSIEQTINSFSSVGKRRRLMSTGATENFPYWLQSKGRKLLNNTNSSSVGVDFVVAKDGSGKFRTIGDALKAVPEKSLKRSVIYVKKGVYVENVKVEKSKWNVMMIGDGMNVTIVSGSLNVVDGTPTFQSATFSVFGKGFIARDMAFVNTAGAAKHQAVALISTADFSVFYRCRFDAYQDTLYTHSNRQFYRNCEVRGTIDFIFGNAAVVFQNTTILVKKPMSGQKNIVTAQGKSDPNQNTGISIQNCSVQPLGSLAGVETYLGRPWKNYSTTVFMGSYMDNIISPKGWLPWSGTTTPDTIFYAEYQNNGPGSVTKSRVNWRGLKVNINSKLANLYTVSKFLSGHQWLPQTGVTFRPGL